MQEVAPDIRIIDTRLAGLAGVSAAYLVMAPEVAIVDPGARTSADTVRAALAAAGVGPDDLRWIVLTHVHLDHCGSAGILAAAFPRARVVVHRRGARHLVAPGRLVAGSAAVYGARWSLYGGLDPVGADRIAVVNDGDRVNLSGGLRLVMIETLGHARHHMSVLEERTGTILAGDALGVRFAGGGLYPALPPPDVDLDAADASLTRLADLAPACLCLSHYGAVDDPEGAIALARRQLARLREAARSVVDCADIGAAIEARLPLEETVGSAPALALWRRLGWAEANVAGVAGWVEAGAR